MILKTIEEKYQEMSPSFRIVSQYIRDNFSDLLFCSITELSERIGVSTATIVRFAHFIGFCGFSGLQDAARGEEHEKKQQERELCSSERGLLNECVEGVESLFTAVDKAGMKALCKDIMEYGRVLIIGYKNAFGTAAELLHRLDAVRENVWFARLLPLEKLPEYMRPDTLVIIVSFSPQYSYTDVCAKFAHKNGCRIVLIADDRLNTMAPLASRTIFLPRKNDGCTKLPNLSAAASFVDYLTVVLSQEYPYSKNDKREDNVLVDTLLRSI